MKTAPDFFSRQVSEARRFYLNLTPPAASKLAVVCGGCEHSARDYRVTRQDFPFYCLEYVIRGRGEAVLGKRTHALQPGSVFSYGPGVRHSLSTNEEEPLVKYFVDFTGTGAIDFLRESQLKPGGFRQLYPANELQALFDELIHNGLRPTARTPELCTRLLECIGLKIAESRAPSKHTETLSFSTYQHCRQFIEQHFMRLKTLEQIAGECHVDAAYLCRLFKRYDHVTPYHLLLRLKLNQSAEWLLQPGSMVKQVAERAGFADQFHFSRKFKSVFGVAPETFKSLR